MKKSVLFWGLGLFLVGIIFGFLSGAILPGNVTIPLLYGSNQILWLFVAFVGLVTIIVSLFLKKKAKSSKK